jgi:hypothetical protein
LPRRESPRRESPRRESPRRESLHYPMPRRSPRNSRHPAAETVSRAPADHHPRDPSPECREIPSFNTAHLPVEAGDSWRPLIAMSEEGTSLLDLDLDVPPLDMSPISCRLRSQSPSQQDLRYRLPPRTTPVRGVSNRKRSTRAAVALATSKAPRVEGEEGPSATAKTPAKTPAKRPPREEV